MSYLIVPAEAEHVKMLAMNLRADDLAEVSAAGMTPQKAVWRSLRRASKAKTAFVDGEIGAMWGVGGCPLGKVGTPWLLTAPPVENAKVAFLREGRYEVAEMLTVFCELKGYVDGRYDRALRFLGALGFTIGPEFAYGPYRTPFRQYTMRRFG